MEGILLMLIGMLASICGAIVGLGGGFIIVPMLALLYVMPAAQIVGTSMAVMMFSALSSSWVFAKQKRIDYKSGLLFSAAMIPCLILGAWTTTFITNSAFFIAFGCFQFVMALFILFKPNKKVKNFLPPTVTRSFVDATGKEYTYSFHIGFGMALSFFVGYLSSLFGIGGGSIMVSAMVILMGFPAHIATATSMFTILLSSIAGSISHAAFDNIVWSKVWWLAAGALLGGQVGAKIASKLPAKLILRLLSVSLMIVAIRLMLKS